MECGRCHSMLKANSSVCSQCEHDNRSSFQAIDPAEFGCKPVKDAVEENFLQGTGGKARSKYRKLAIAMISIALAVIGVLLLLANRN